MEELKFTQKEVKEINNSLIELEEEEASDFSGFSTAGSFSTVASWGACVSSGSSLSSAGN